MTTPASVQSQIDNIHLQINQLDQKRDDLMKELNDLQYIQRIVEEVQNEERRNFIKQLVDNVEKKDKNI